MTWLLTFLGIVSLVLLHEFGHFAVAKAVGMRVERFSLFFRPMLVKVKRGETEYGIGPIPLGGYVKISGMNPAEELPEGEEHRGFYRQPVWKRVAVIAAGPAMNILVAFVLLAGVYWLSAQHPAARGPRSPRSRRHAGPGVLRQGDVLLAVDGKPVRSRAKRSASSARSHRTLCRREPRAAAATPVALHRQRGSQQLQLQSTRAMTRSSNGCSSASAPARS